MTDDKDPRSGFDGKMSQSRFLDDCREVSYSMGLIVISSSTNSPEPGEPSFAVNVQPDFRALPSKPPLIYRTGIDPNLAYTEQPERELPYPVFSHPIRENWLTIGERLYRLLDTQGVRWSTIDPIRFKFPSKRPGPLHIWVGVEPDSLGFEKAKEVAAACKRMLAETGHEDIEMAFRESSYSSLAGPDFISLQSAVRDKDFMDNLRCPFAPCLGIAIAPRQTPHHEATGGIYLCEGGARNRLLLLTARHAVLPKTTHPNNTVFEQKPPGQRQNKQDIILLGTRAYANAVDSIMGHIGKHLKEVERQRADWDLLSPREKSEIAEVETLVERLTKFYNEATLGWASPTMRIIGQVLYAPPLAVVRVGERQHTEDWALVEINKAKLQSNEFCGNVMFLGMSSFPDATVLVCAQFINHIQASKPCPKLHPSMTRCTRAFKALHISNFHVTASSRFKELRHRAKSASPTNSIAMASLHFRW